MKPLYILFSFLWLLSYSASADEVFSVARINCVPEAELYVADISNLEGIHRFLHKEDGTSHSDKVNLYKNKYNIVVPSASGTQHDCKLANSHFTLSLFQAKPQPRGFCGAAPRVFMSITRNGQKWIDNVLVSEPCFEHHPGYIESMIVADDGENSPPSVYVDTHYVDFSTSQRNITSKRNQLHNFSRINQETINCIASLKKDYFRENEYLDLCENNAENNP